MTEEKPKARSSRQKDEAPAFTSSIFAFLDVYLTKMLVRPLVSLPNILVSDYGLPKPAQHLFLVPYKNQENVLSQSIQQGAALHQIIIFFTCPTPEDPNVLATAATGLLLNNSPLAQVGWLSYVTMVMYLIGGRSPGGCVM